MSSAYTLMFVFIFNINDVYCRNVEATLGGKVRRLGLAR